MPTTSPQPQAKFQAKDQSLAQAEVNAQTQSVAPLLAGLSQKVRLNQNALSQAEGHSQAELPQDALS